MKNVILVSILSAVTSIGGFQYWQHQQEVKAQLVEKQEKSCQRHIDSASEYIQSSQPLTQTVNGETLSGILHPGLNSEFKKDSTYIVIPEKGSSTLPKNTKVYDSKRLGLLLKAQSFPSPLLVTAISIDRDKKEATVYSSCAKEAFNVPLVNLYEKFQTFKYKNSDDSESSLYGF